MDDCIVICMPTAQVEMARAVRKVYEKPVVWVVLWEFVEERIPLTEAEIRELGEIRSLPQFYYSCIGAVRTMSDSRLDEAQLAIEARLGILNNALVVSFDRNFRNVRDFRTARELQYINLMFVEKLLNECSPSFVATGRECYLRNTLADAALRRGIPCGALTMLRNLSNRIVAVDHRGLHMGMRECYEALMRGEEGTFAQEDLAQADAAYKRFLDRPLQPTSVVKFRGRTTFGRVRTALTGGWRHLLDNARRYREHEYDRVSGQTISSASLLRLWPAKLLRLLYMNRSPVLTRTPDLRRRYIYLPLHHEPEQTDMYYGYEHSHHEAFVAEVSRRIPSDCVLFVKDHVSMAGTRSIGFFERLSRIYNVEFVHTAADTFQLIQNAAAVMTVTGTAGWEAFLLGRPVIALGDVFYNFLPGVFSGNLRDRDFALRLATYLREFRPDPCVQQAAVRAYVLCGRPLDVPIGLGDAATEDAHAEHIVREEKALYDRWGPAFVERAQSDPWWSLGRCP